MKRKLVVRLLVWLALFGALWLLQPVGFSAEDMDTSYLTLAYQEANAPVETAYADLLIRMAPSDEAYTDFAAVLTRRMQAGENDTAVDAYAPLCEITPDSEIARYNKDGYVSLTLHGRSMAYFRQNAVETDGNRTYAIQLDHAAPYGSMPALAGEYKHFRVAYVDEHGAVLGVTETVRARSRLHAAYAFRADGDALELDLKVAGQKQMLTLFLFLAAAALLLSGLLFAGIGAIRRGLERRAVKQRDSKR